MQKKQIYALVKFYRGIFDGVELLWDEAKALKAFKVYTGCKYPKLWEGGILEEYKGCSILLLNILEETEVT